MKLMRQERHLLNIKGENNYTKLQPELMNGKRQNARSRGILRKESERL
jgi:hypothetical protein